MKYTSEINIKDLLVYIDTELGKISVQGDSVMILYRVRSELTNAFSQIEESADDTTAKEEKKSIPEGG